LQNCYDLDNTRQVSASYTVSVSGTWEKKTITFPADTTGAFDNDNVLGLCICSFIWVLEAIYFWNIEHHLGINSYR
jgi:hypothetical protein